MIVTIDGPAGSGKSTAAKALAARLDFQFLDTGAMYRAVTLAALRRQIDLASSDALARLITEIEVELSDGKVFLSGEDVTSHIRTKEITAASGAIADSPAIRRRLVELQRAVAQTGNFVCEGRDQGTIVFPDALCKFFLVADPLERARRRQRDMAARGEAVSLEDVVAAQHIRDERDAARDIAPMIPAADAITLDSTQLSLHEVVDRMEQEVRGRLARQARPKCRSPVNGSD